MKTTILALTALAALTATPAFAGGTHINVGFYSPAPVVYRPAPVYYQPPVVYYPPVQHVYYAPPRPYYYRPHWEARNHHDRRDHRYNVAWNDRDRDRGPGGWNGPRH